MRIRTALCLLALLCLNSCRGLFSLLDFSDSVGDRSYFSGNSNLNPPQLTLQYLTCQVKLKTGEWPESVAQYQVIFGDTMNFVLNQFPSLQFQNNHDSLVVVYELSPFQAPPPDSLRLEFVPRDTIHLQLKFSSQSTYWGLPPDRKKKQEVKLWVGSLVFRATADSIFLVNQRTAALVARNEWDLRKRQ